MVGWGKRKDGQAYPKDGKKGVKSSSTNAVGDVHLKSSEFMERKFEGNFRGIDDDWNDLSPKEKEIRFGDIMENYWDSETKFANYNYGNLPWNKLPDRFKEEYQKKRARMTSQEGY